MAFSRRTLMLGARMNIPKFWARGTHDGVHSWRGSSVSEADARAQADMAARNLAARFEAGQLRNARHDYYGDRPCREPILREFAGRNGSPAAVVTRNGYGCLVLNAAHALFVDVDVPETAPRASGGFLGRLFGGKTSPEQPTPVIESLRRWQQANPNWSWRLYRTRAGFRLLATHDVFEPNSSLVGSVFDAFGADPLYRQLCRTQQCFRARLTPKPWRCGHRSAPRGWPWLDANKERAFTDWQREYEEASRGFATCQFVQTEGRATIHPEIAALVAYHDEITRVNSGAPLA